MNRTLRDLLVVAGGLCTSAATTLVLWFLLHYLHFALYSISYWFIPFGAIACGIAAGSGYYFACQKLHYKATTLVLANLLSMSVATFFVVQYLQYYYLDVNGVPARAVISFPGFLNVFIRNSTVGMLWGPQTGPLGAFGYVAILLPIGGFAAGGYYLFSKLRVQPYCDRCGLYLQRRLLDSRYTVQPSEIKELFVVLKAYFRRREPVAAVNYFAKWGLNVPPRGGKLMVDIELFPCRRCLGEWVQFQGRVLVQEDWKAIEKFYVSGFFPKPATVAPAEPKTDAASA